MLSSELTEYPELSESEPVSQSIQKWREEGKQQNHVLNHVLRKFSEKNLYVNKSFPFVIC